MHHVAECRVVTRDHGRGKISDAGGVTQQVMRRDLAHTIVQAFDTTRYGFVQLDLVLFRECEECGSREHLRR